MRGQGRWARGQVGERAGKWASKQVGKQAAWAGPRIIMVGSPLPINQCNAMQRVGGMLRQARGAGRVAGRGSGSGKSQGKPAQDAEHPSVAGHPTGRIVWALHPGQPVPATVHANE